MISTTAINPLIREFTSELLQTQPVFEVSPSSIHILNEPRQFYSKLLNMIQGADRRIFLSSLYIGSEEHELIHALTSKLRERPNLRLDLLLDLNRSTRPGKNSTAKILLPLLREFPSRVQVSMFRSPNLRGLLAHVIPPRFREGWGTWHAKIYGVDNDVMISGANLNKSYFTNRQDRYLHFSSEKSLAQYCFEFMETMSKFSFRLLPRESLDSGNALANAHSDSYEDYTLHWHNVDTHPYRFNEFAETAISQLQNSYRKPSKISGLHVESPLTHTVFIFPIIQAGQFNIREEECAFHRLFRYLKQSSKTSFLDFTSGYFSIYRPYQDLILQTANVNCRIVASSPKANGFHGSTGISGRIPEGYTLYEQRFMKAVSKSSRLWQGTSDIEGAGVLLNEWEKPGWTYHAKGIWLSPDHATPPVLTLFGSTNLNSRSAEIDSELSFLLIVPSEFQTPTADQGFSSFQKLREDLACEIDRIRSNLLPWQGKNRKVRWTTKLIVWLVKGML